MLPVLLLTLVITFYLTHVIRAALKVKCSLVQALRLCTGRTAHRGSRGIALLFHDHGTRRGWGVSVTPRPLFTPRKDLVSIVQEVGWAPVSVCTGAENLASSGIRFPNRPARNQSLYRLSYPAHFMICTHQIFEGWNQEESNAARVEFFAGRERCIQGFGGETWRKETTWKTWA